MNLYGIPYTHYRQAFGDTHVLETYEQLVTDPFAAATLVAELRNRGYRIEYQGQGFIVVSALPIPALGYP